MLENKQHVREYIFLVSHTSKNVPSTKTNTPSMTFDRAKRIDVEE